MTDVSAYADDRNHGDPAPSVRIFGWAMLTILAAFMINNVLVIGFNFPGTRAAFKDGDGFAFLQLGLYVLAILLAVAFVLGTTNRTLRRDAALISDFNAFLIRGCFWTVLIVGVADAAIAFMRVENLLSLFVDGQTVQALNRSQYVGPNVHVPLMIASFILALFTRTLGFTWLALLIVVAELLIVISRFVFSYEQALMGDLVRYWYAALFLFASAYTLLDEGHVRVDVLYAGFSSRTRGFVNAIGAILLGLTTCWVIIVIGFGGKQAIINSPIANFEISQTGSVGMFIKYHMAAFLGVFAITMLIQFVSYLFEAVADMRSEPGAREHSAPSH
jgi:TRAP-type mannitol/chloroaromatic compound transport system permease small subunit